MTIKSGFFNSVNGDRKYNAADIGRFLHGIVSSGVYADTPGSLQVIATNGRNIQVQAGRAMLDYHYMENDSPLTLTLSPGSTQDRYDAVVAVLDVTARLCDIVVREGTPASNPTVPTVQRTDTIKEYMLAYVRVSKYATEITQDNITDTRPDNTVCGWVHGLIQQVDTSTLYAQYEEAYANKMAELDLYIAEKKTEIDSRLDSIDSTINATNVVGVPIPTASNAGQVPTVNRSGTRYTLAHPSVRVKRLNDGKLTLSDYGADDAGLYLFEGGGNVVAKTAAETFENIGKWSNGALCHISYSEMLGTGGAIVGRTTTLIDFAAGKTYTETVKWDADGVETSWEYTEKSRFVTTVNKVSPDADGNVSA